jgi:fructose-specific phosphotransferase system component IIB
MMDNPTPENIARRDALILEKEEAIKQKRREYSRRYHAKVRAELNAWREQQKQLEGEVK